MEKQAHLGDVSYDAHEFGSTWWMQRAHSAIHQRAYKRIVKDLQTNLTREPAHIIDYACGPGLLLRELAKTFPRTRLTGLDESEQGLAGAAEILAGTRGIRDRERITLLRTVLPDFDLVLPKADVVIWSFPDLRGTDERTFVKRWKQTCRREWKRSRRLKKRLRKMDAEIPFSSRDFFGKRLAHRNLRQLVRRGGLMVTADYSEAELHDCEEIYLEAMAWYEGTLKPPIPEGDPGRDRFARSLFSRYHRSRVIEDVHDQTQDPTDLQGGFLVHVLRAV